MADFSQKNRKKCKKIFHIFITYYNTDGCKKRKIFVFFRHVAECIRILITFAFGTGARSCVPTLTFKN